jgi:hypothetical protein
MNEILNTIFGLEGVGFGEEGVELGFARPIPAWGWFFVIVLAVMLAWWSYRRLDGARVSRSGLAALRALALLLLVFLISGPQLVRPNDRVEQDWVLMLVDRSASMTIADVSGGASGRQTREQQLRMGVESAWPALSAMMNERTVLWLGFDSGVYDLAVRRDEAGAPQPLDPGPAVGRRTSLGASLDQALARAAARPVSGVVIFSDGRSVDEPTRQAVRRLQAERIPVVVVPLGSAEPMADLAVMRSEAPGLAFLEDHIPVSVEIERLGGTPGASRGKLELVDLQTGSILDERPLPEADQWEEGRARITLTTRPQRAGKQSWQVRLIPETPDLIQENNFGEVTLEVVDRPVRVVYFDGYPRWEYRYLKNLLLREPSIQSSTLLLASNRQYLQEGDVLLDALPRSPEDWARFDVVVIGDVSPNVFSREQLEQLREHIAVRGAGLLWIGGEGATPGAWRDTPLADLLPFSIGRASSAGDGQIVRAWGEPVLIVPTPSARRLNLLQLTDDPDNSWPSALSDPRTGWSLMQWAQRIDPASVKPTAEVLAQFIPAASARATGAEGGGESASATPALLSMRYGAGRILYAATDEIWRWRYARGETLPERFWLPLLRLQGRESLARTARPGLLEVSPRRPEVQQPVRLAVHLLDQSLLDAAPSQTAVRIRSLDDPNSPPTELTLAPEQAAQQGGGIGGMGGMRAARSFATVWVPSEPGRYRIEPVDPLLTGLGLAVETEVSLPDDELRRPETDHAVLANLSGQSGGQILPVARLADLPDLLPKREVHISGTPDIQTLWDKPLFFIMLLTLLAVEWIGRRLLRLS